MEFLYREQRGGFSPSMRTQRIITSKRCIPNIPDHKTIDDVTIEYYGYDKRIKSPCWIVHIKGYGVLGFVYLSESDIFN